MSFSVESNAAPSLPQYIVVTIDNIFNHLPAMHQQPFLGESYLATIRRQIEDD